MNGWDELAATAATLPTQTESWASAAVAAFGGEARTIAVEGPSGRLDAVAALVDDGRQLTLAGAEETGEPVDVLARTPEALGELAERIARLNRPLVLSRVPAASPTVAALRAAIGRRGLVRTSDATPYPAIELAGDERWREVGGGLSSSRRSALRRSRRKADKAGEVEVELLAPTPAEVAPLLDEAFAIEARSWKAEAGTALLQMPRQGDFFRRYADAMARQGLLRVQLLRVGGVRVAVQIAVEWKRRLWLLKVGFDASRRDFSPGQLLLAESVANAAGRELTHYELLGTVTDWTNQWTKAVHDTVRVAVYPASPSGARELSRLAAAEARTRAGRRRRAAVDAAAEIVASRYVAGRSLGDALAEAARQAAAAGYETVVGHWGADRDPPAEVTAGCFKAAGALASGSQLAIKLPAMKADAATLDDLLSACRARDLGLHLDALAPGDADAGIAQALRLADAAPGAVGCALPGRWGRSVDDARAVADASVRVRVVKGEWPAADRDRERDPVAGFLDVVGALAGRRHAVEVATQDAALAAEALEVLRRAGTPVELQVLYAMDGRAAVRAARAIGVPVRVYVPYGRGRIPYELDRRPATVARFAHDLLPWTSHTPPGRRRARLLRR